MMSVLSFLRSCLFCENLWVKTDAICPSCWRQIKKISEETSFSGRTFSGRSHICSFRVHRIWVWNKASNFFLKPLMYGLKGGQFLKTADRLASWLSLRLLLGMSDEGIMKKKKADLVFIPAPARVLGQRDHAWRLAASLALHTGGKIEDVLMRGKNFKPQKAKNKFQRKKLFMELQDSSWKSSHRNVYVFVDDVITTGATVETAYKTLGKPKYFLMAVLSDRPLFSR